MAPEKTTRRGERERQALVRKLRVRYIDGRLDEILIPDEPDMTRLMQDLFPDRQQK